MLQHELALSHQQRQQGFTLVELLITIAILAILVMLAAPSMQHMLAENRSIAQVNTLIAELNYARSEAVSRNEALTFCKSVNQQTCGGQWRDGKMLLDAKNNVIRVFSALPTGDKLVWNSSGGQDDAIVWTPSGYTRGQRGTFYYCSAHKDSTYSRTVVLWDTGRTYTAKMSAGDYSKYCL